MVTRDNLILIKRVKFWGSKLRGRGGGLERRISLVLKHL